MDSVCFHFPLKGYSKYCISIIYSFAAHSKSKYRIKCDKRASRTRMIALFMRALLPLESASGAICEHAFAFTKRCSTVR